jgi:purine-binding chemotaxis protein CheW
MSLSEKQGDPQFIIVKIGEQIFGISVDYVVDVLAPKAITSVPLARKEVVGLLNLRGRIISALDIRVLLDISDKTDIEQNMCVVIEYERELYSLMVDEVGKVVSLNLDELVPTPDNLSKFWRDVSLGVVLMNEDLLVILDINKIMKLLVG